MPSADPTVTNMPVSPSSHPSRQPSIQPTEQPNGIPSGQPTSVPTANATQANGTIDYITLHVNAPGNYKRNASNIDFVVNATGDTRVTSRGGKDKFTVIRKPQTKLVVDNFNTNFDLVDCRAFEEITNFTQVNITRGSPPASKKQRGSTTIELPENQKIHLTNVPPEELEARHFLLFEPEVVHKQRDGNDLVERIFTWLAISVGILVVINYTVEIGYAINRWWKTGRFAKVHCEEDNPTHILVITEPERPKEPRRERPVAKRDESGEEGEEKSSNSSSDENVSEGKHRTFNEFRASAHKKVTRRRVQARLDSIASRHPHRLADLTETSIREAATEEEAQTIRECFQVIKDRSRSPSETSGEEKTDGGQPRETDVGSEVTERTLQPSLPSMSSLTDDNVYPSADCLPTLSSLTDSNEWLSTGSDKASIVTSLGHVADVDGSLTGSGSNDGSGSGNGCGGNGGGISSGGGGSSGQRSKQTGVHKLSARDSNGSGSSVDDKGRSSMSSTVASRDQKGGSSSQSSSSESETTPVLPRPYPMPVSTSSEEPPRTTVFRDLLVRQQRVGQQLRNHFARRGRVQNLCAALDEAAENEPQQEQEQTGDADEESVHSAAVSNASSGPSVTPATQTVPRHPIMSMVDGSMALLGVLLTNGRAVVTDGTAQSNVHELVQQLEEEGEGTEEVRLADMV
jgi:hypothetical protein